MTDAPLRNDARNDGLALSPRRSTCPRCQRGFTPVGRRRFCSDACRQATWRARHPENLVTAIVLPPRTPRSATIYECPSCQTRSLGEQRCPDCNTFSRRVGPGGLCPSCDEPVAVTDLLAADPHGGAATNTS
jgi:hypothetical protein